MLTCSDAVDRATIREDTAKKVYSCSKMLRPDEEMLLAPVKNTKGTMKEVEYSGKDRENNLGLAGELIKQRKAVANKIQEEEDEEKKEAEPLPSIAVESNGSMSTSGINTTTRGIDDIKKVCVIDGDDTNNKKDYGAKGYNCNSNKNGNDINNSSDEDIYGNNTYDITSDDNDNHHTQKRYDNNCCGENCDNDHVNDSDNKTNSADACNSNCKKIKDTDSSDTGDGECNDDDSNTTSSLRTKIPRLSNNIGSSGSSCHNNNSSQIQLAQIILTDSDNKKKIFSYTPQGILMNASCDENSISTSSSDNDNILSASSQIAHMHICIDENDRMTSPELKASPTQMNLPGKNNSSAIFSTSQRLSPKEVIPSGALPLVQSLTTHLPLTLVPTKCLISETTSSPKNNLKNSRVDSNHACYSNKKRSHANTNASDHSERDHLLWIENNKAGVEETFKEQQRLAPFSLAADSDASRVIQQKKQRPGRQQQRHSISTTNPATMEFRVKSTMDSTSSHSTGFTQRRSSVALSSTVNHPHQALAFAEEARPSRQNAASVVHSATENIAQTTVDNVVIEEACTGVQSKVRTQKGGNEYRKLNTKPSMPAPPANYPSIPTTTRPKDSKELRMQQQRQRGQENSNKQEGEIQIQKRGTNGNNLVSPDKVATFKNDLTDNSEKDKTNMTPHKGNTTCDATSGIAVTTPNNNDVICGRGMCSCSHPGNCYYLCLISEHAKKCRMLNDRNKQEVAKMIVFIINEKKGRFLQRDHSNNLSTNTIKAGGEAKPPAIVRWYEIAEDRAITKTYQKLKAAVQELNQQIKKQEQQQQPFGYNQYLQMQKNVKQEESVEAKENMDTDDTGDPRAFASLSPNRKNKLKTLTTLQPWEVRQAVKLISIPPKTLRAKIRKDNNRSSSPGNSKKSTTKSCPSRAGGKTTRIPGVNQNKLGTRKTKKHSKKAVSAKKNIGRKPAPSVQQMTAGVVKSGGTATVAGSAGAAILGTTAETKANASASEEIKKTVKGSKTTSMFMDRQAVPLLATATEQKENTSAFKQRKKTTVKETSTMSMSVDRQAPPIVITPNIKQPLVYSPVIPCPSRSRYNANYSFNQMAYRKDRNAVYQGGASRDKSCKMSKQETKKPPIKMEDEHIWPTTNLNDDTAFAATGDKDESMGTPFAYLPPGPEQQFNSFHISSTTVYHGPPSHKQKYYQNGTESKGNANSENFGNDDLLTPIPLVLTRGRSHSLPFNTETRTSIYSDAIITDSSDRGSEFGLNIFSNLHHHSHSRDYCDNLYSPPSSTRYHHHTSAQRRSSLPICTPTSGTMTNQYQQAENDGTFHVPNHVAKNWKFEPESYDREQSFDSLFHNFTENNNAHF